MNFILTGLAGSGKSTVAKYLEEHHNIKEFALADKLKQLVFRLCKTFDVPINSVEDLYNVSTKNNYRKYLQQVGTECCRAVFGNNFWCDMLKKSIHDYGKDVVISDIRFINEYAYFKERAICIKITGRQFDDPNIHKHASELEIMNIPCDYEIVNDGTLEELYAKVEDVLNKVKHVDDEILILDVNKNKFDIDMLTKQVNTTVSNSSLPKNASNSSLPLLAKTSSSTELQRANSSLPRLKSPDNDTNSSRKNFTITREPTGSIESVVPATLQASTSQPTLQTTTMKQHMSTSMQPTHVDNVRATTLQPTHVDNVQKQHMQTSMQPNTPQHTLQLNTSQPTLPPNTSQQCMASNDNKLFDLTVFEKQSTNTAPKESKSSYQLGVEGEADIADLIAQVAPKYEIVNTSKIAHSCDLHVLDTKNRIKYLVECKNKQTIDRKGDIDKFINDVELERIKQTTSDGYNVVGIFFAIRNDKIPTIGEYAFMNSMIYLSRTYINKEVLRIIFSMFKFYVKLQTPAKHNDSSELSPETRKMLDCLRSECSKFEEEKNTYNKMLKNANAIVSDIQGLSKNITIKETIIRMIDFPSLIDSHVENPKDSKTKCEEKDVNIPSLVEQSDVQPSAPKKVGRPAKSRTTTVMFSEACRNNKDGMLETPIRARQTSDYTPEQWVEIIALADNIRVDSDVKKRTDLISMVNMNIYKAIGKFGSITYDIWKNHSEDELRKFQRKITNVVKNATTASWPFTIKELKVEFPEFIQDLRRMTREDVIRNYSIKEDL